MEGINGPVLNFAACSLPVCKLPLYKVGLITEQGQPPLTRAPMSSQPLALSGTDQEAASALTELYLLPPASRK